MEFIDVIRLKLRKYSIIKKALSPLYTIYHHYIIYKLNRSYTKYGLDAFNVFCRTLNDINCSYWPEFGTLLGIYREGDFIKHDNDFDFGSFIQNRDTIISALKNAGIELIHTYRCPDLEYIREDTFSYRGVHIDVFYFHSIGKKDYCHTFVPFEVNDGMQLHYKIKIFEFDAISLKEIDFKNLKISIPADTQSHLKVSYGENFMTPDPNFKSITNTFIEGHYAVQEKQ